MNENFRRQLEENGADVEATIKRFMGNEALYMKFLGKFLDDPNYGKLGDSIEAKDYEEAFKCAHTLKGVTANLGLEPIQNAVSELTEELRGKQADEINTDAVNQKFEKVKEHFEKFHSVISENL